MSMSIYKAAKIGPFSKGSGPSSGGNNDGKWDSILAIIGLVLVLIYIIVC